MPNLHDIERRISSVTSTKQVTRTMEMVAAAKIRRCTDRVDAATPYATSMSEMLAHVAEASGETSSALLREHDQVKGVLLVVVVSDRGLAGGFNTNVLRTAEHLMKEKQAAGASVYVVACGKKALSYFSYRKVEPVLEFKDMSADPTTDEAFEIAEYAITEFEAHNLDEVYVIYNHAKNAGEQILRTEQVLPVNAQKLLALGTSAAGKRAGEAQGAPAGATTAGAAAAGGAGTPAGEPATLLATGVEFEPNAEEVLNQLLPAYVRTTLYHGLVDSAAAEQGARRTAMKSATDNANEMVQTLTRIYNRVRQGAITTEITEIVGGAAALEE